MPRTASIFVLNGEATAPRRIALEPGKSERHAYNELWLQNLIQSHPETLPISDIEPGFGRLIPVSTEVSCGHGYIDNLFVTAEGGIAIVETKLWRNPEARRLVVAQVLDYAAALGRMGYSEFEAAALSGKFPHGAAKPSSLHAVTMASPDALPEDEFIDAVARNLRRGRLLVLAAGDGIRSETETLADLLQSHAGARFTFALVAIELFDLNGGVLAVPRPIVKTAIIERGVVSVLDDRAVVSAPQQQPNSAPVAAKDRVTMTEELFMEALGKIAPELPGTLRMLIDRASALGIAPQWRAALSLKWLGWPDGAVNLAVITKEGLFWTDSANWKLEPEQVRQYNEDLAKAFGGHVRDRGNGPYLVGQDGKNMRLAEVLPKKLDDWIDAMERFVGRLQAEAAERD